jgi:class 3 adenylate cyclase
MCMLFAAQHPERTRALVLYAAAPRLSRAPGYPQGKEPGRMVRLLDGLVDAWGEGRMLGAWAPSRAGDDALRSWWAGLQRMGASPGTARELFAMYPDADVRSILGAIHVPTLVLHRTGDVLIDIEVARYTAAHIPGARLVELDGRDHLFFVGDVDRPLAEIEEFLTGARPAARQPDRVLATVLFVDVAGSTELVSRIGDAAWASTREQFLGLARHALVEHDGREVDVAGDGLLATFPGPARAIRCAVAVRDAAEAVGLRLRAGVHAGEVQRDEAGGLSGLAVHIGARVMAEAEPGEVLVSGTVRDLVVGSGLRFEDRGVRALRGVPGRWPVYAVVP